MIIKWIENLGYRDYKAKKNLPENGCLQAQSYLFPKPLDTEIMMIRLAIYLNL